MMLAYLNLHKYPTKLFKVSDLVSTLDWPGWGDPRKKIQYSANDVLRNKKKYAMDYAYIKRADLKYPIIMYCGNVIDGVHRLANAKLKDLETIKAYVFDKKTMDKFIIAHAGEWKKIDNMTIREILERWETKISKIL